MLVVSDSDAIRHITGRLARKPDERDPDFVCYFGAGGSVEAGVPTATEICCEIRRELRQAASLPLHSDEREIGSMGCHRARLGQTHMLHD